MRTRLLGGLEIEGLRPTEIGSRKARTLVKVLALGRGAPVPVDRVIDALWGEAVPARPLDQVGVLVSRLRAVLGADRLPRTDTGWSLQADWLDVTELDERVQEAADRLAAGLAALALVRGDLLADEPDAPWAAADRAAVALQVGRARTVAAEAALASGDPAPAVALAAAALDRAPNDEDALRILMRAHVAAGRPGAALATYARTRALLADDLGADPAAPTERLHEEILRGRPEPVAAPEPGGPPFAGRTGELAALDRQLAGVDGGAALVEVVGEAGIGKTALGRWVHALGARALVLAGRCDELGRGLPLQPVLDALDAHLRRLAPDAAQAVLGDDAPLVGPLLAAGTGRASAAAPPGASPAALTDPAAGQALLFAALLRVVARAGGGPSPTVLVVEDVPLADPATAAWLRFAVRRGERLLVVVTRRGGEAAPGAVRLGPLELSDVAELVGPERAQRLHARSGGNPLFLAALAAAGEGELPATVRASVGGRADALGSAAAATLRVAAVLGREVDVDLLAAVLDTGVRELLSHLEAGVAVRLVDDRGPVLAFPHELVREALAESTTAARRAFVHREAARVLAARPHHDPLAVAWHARLGGDSERAAHALRAAAEHAVARHDLAGARAHLDEAVRLADGAPARLARARVGILQLDLPAAAHDAERAVALGAGAAALELAGWVAYYRRDTAAAERFARAGHEQATDEVLLASCALLLGRVRHTRGELAAADTLLSEAVEIGPVQVRSVARAWLGSLRCHQGRAVEALELAEQALVAPDLAHTFAVGHALFARVYARGLCGDPVGALLAVDRLDALVTEQKEQARRFVGIAANLRGWLLRAVGREDEARELNAVAVALPRGALLDEPRGAGLLDLADGLLRTGDLAGAAEQLDRAGWIETWEGSMYWRQRHRLDLLRARLALAGGDAAASLELARAVEADARARGARRYQVLAAVVAARAAAAVGEPVDLDTLDGVLADLDTVAGLEAWWVTAEAAADLRVDRWWAAADRRAAALIAAAGPDADALRRAVAARLACP